jgi:hypothetical protein
MVRCRGIRLGGLRLHPASHRYKSYDQQPKLQLFPVHDTPLLLAPLSASVRFVMQGGNPWDVTFA